MKRLGMNDRCPDCGGPLQCLTEPENDDHPRMACAEGSFCPGLECAHHHDDGSGTCPHCGSDEAKP